jgi:hypothetical protein
MTECLRCDVFASSDNFKWIWKNMTAEDYRRIALAQPEAIESSHMDHPDFRVRGKIFATIRSVSKGEGVLKLTTEQQKQFIREDAKVFGAVPGGWGVKGWTLVQLAPAATEIVSRAMRCAWRNAAPKRLIAQIDAES